ncbi:MAG: hypothetical protein JOZ54_13345 [Acidobacteria bacterium]|nr:hypothetical protein [Acidobacteriota bacterium]
MRKVTFCLLSLLLVASLDAQSRRRPGNAPPPPSNAPQQNNQQPAAGQPLAGLTAAQLDLFNDGLGDFTEVETAADGLGPVFNERSCSACHTTPAIGGGSNTRLVTRFARTVAGVYDALDNLGGSLMQDHAIGPADGCSHQYAAEIVPPGATFVVHRRSTPLFGLGFIDATPDSDFVAMAASQAARGDGVVGRVNMVDNIRAGMKTVGKFGWKSQVPTLLQFSGDAYLNELGITSGDFPHESCPQGNCAELSFNPAPGINDDGSGIEALRDFMSMLAPPPRGAQNRDTDDGAQTFDRIGCTSCHVANMRTGSSAIAALDRKTYHPYSDFLLHDMGTLGDGIVMGSSTTSEMRTAPLWGLRFVTAYLHDGRASTVEQAILAHEGQGKASRDRFNALERREKQRLLVFLNSL